MDKYRQHGQPPHIKQVKTPLIWTTWTTEHRHTAPACTYPRPKRRFLRRNGRFYSRNSGFLRQKAPFMQQEAKASTDEKRPATCRHHRPALRLYHTRPARYGQRGQYGQRGHRRPPLCVRICPVVCPYLQRTPKPPPAPNRGIYRQTPRRGGAAFTPARYERHRQRGQSLNRRKGNRPRYGQI